MQGKFLTLTEFSTEVGVSPSTIKKIEKSGDFSPHHRTPGGKRLYADTQIEEFFNLYNKKKSTEVK